MSASKTGEINLIVDIGSQSVGGALVILGDVPEIVFSKRIRLPWSKVRNEEKTGELILKSLNELLGIVLKEGATALHLDEHKLESKKIKRVLCVVSSPWCVSKTSSLTYKGEKSLEITPKIMESILTQDESREANVTVDNKDYRLIEKKVLRVKLNGYVTLNYLNKKATNIEVSVFEGRILEEFMIKVEKILSRLINADVVFHSYTLSSLAVVQDLFPQTKNYVLTEITGGRTDVTLIEDGLIKRTESFEKEIGRAHV